MLDKKAKQEISIAISQAENLTTGEIRVHFKSKCKNDVLEEAKKIFNTLGMHKTKEKNAVLIFLALDSRKFAIIGDIGIHRLVKDEFWDETKELMQSYFKKGEIKEGLLNGVQSVGQKLTLYFPKTETDGDELSNEVTED